MNNTQWFAQNALWNAEWVTKAICPWRQDLPWIEDRRPSPDQLSEMQLMCERCPVLKQCAAFALDTRGGKGIDGGFYAGQWFPWPYSSESADIRLLRRRSRERLKQILGR